MSKNKGHNLKVVGGNAPWVDTKSTYKDDDWWTQYGYDGSKASVGGGKVTGTVGERCFHSHPAVEIEPGCVIYGGSCSSPKIKDADIYVGFDRGMDMTERSLPWTPGVEFLYPIRDMNAPSNPATFKKLIEWLAEQLRAGKKVHIGCIGGHGRTGTVMAALVKHMTGNADAIAWVRQHYCKKAVETKEQVSFLVDQFGCKPAAGTKSYSTGSSSGSQKSLGYHQPKSIGKGNTSPTAFTPMMQRYTLFTG